MLAGCYYEGTGVDEDDAEAVKWHIKSAEHGYGAAQYMSGVSYRNGYGVERDYIKAIEWYTKAAEQNDSDEYVVRAQRALGFIYYCGYDGSAPDYEKAMKCYEKAAMERHDREAKQMLSIIERSIEISEKQ